MGIIFDLRYALRGLRRSVAFATTAIVVLGLAIGANTAAFSVIDAALLKRLPVEAPAELVAVDVGRRPFSFPLLLEMQRRQTVLTGVAASGSAELDTIRVNGRLDNIDAEAAFASANYFDLLGVQATPGQLFNPGALQGNDDVVVISDRFWDQQFSRDASAVGTILFLNGRPFTIVGVTSPGFFGDRVGVIRDFWLPMSTQPSLASRNLLEARTASWFSAFGRLRPGITDIDAAGQLTAIFHEFRGAEIAAGIGSRNPRFTANSSQVRVTALDSLRPVALPVGALVAAVGLVLVIGCFNLGQLLVIRGASRRREMAIRSSLGASRGALVRPLLIETALLGVAGCVCALLVAAWASDALRAAAASSFGALEIVVDYRVVAFSIVVAAVTALLVGTIPAWRAASAPFELRSTSRPPEGRLARGLVVGQLAATLCLLVGAVLLLRTLYNVGHADLGIEPDRVTVTELILEHTDGDGPPVETVRSAVLTALSRLPWVESAAFSGYGHFRGGMWTSPVFVPGSPAVSRAGDAVRRNPVSADYFQTVGQAVVAGRVFSEADAGAFRVILNEAMARRYFGVANPIGATIHFPGLDERGRYRPFNESPGNAFVVIGVVDDAKYDDLREAAVPMAYHLMAATDTELGLLHVRAAPGFTSDGFADAIRQAHPALLIRRTGPLSNDLQLSVARERLFAGLFGTFAGLALLLATVGLYGVLTYAVSQRRHEIGVRMAVGATRYQILSLIVRDGGRLTALGCAIGFPLAVAGTRSIAALLYGVTRFDALTAAWVTGTMAVIAIAATIGPARLALRSDPVVALRAE